ncbi:MAG: hypothetical protein BGN83_22595 [Rhizobium sp. 63-7]|nr:MAG: hypothetical protein BGN83_22595 [Rhizobium sp. 63-7]
MSAMSIFTTPRTILALAFLLALPLPSFAADKATQVIIEQPQASETSRQRIDNLFAQLKRQRDPDTAKGIANQIAMEWNDSGSATVNLLMQWAETAIGEKRNAAAFDFLDQVTLLKPDYVEGWNRRATLHYALGNTRKSMSDINRVLALEPRHFGALAGMAAIMSESNREALALKAWERYLEIYPADRNAQEQMNTISEKLAGSRS